MVVTVSAVHCAGITASIVRLLRPENQLGPNRILLADSHPEFKKMVPNAELVSVMDINPQLGKEVAAQYGLPHS